MGNAVDIRVIKKDLRINYRKIRKNFTKEEKQLYDNQIYNRIINFDAYKKADTLLCFVSTDLEVDTIQLIQNAFSMNKTVAVPKCLDLKGKMDFYVIKSLDDLQKDSYGLLEPEIEKSVSFNNYNNSICILPGFAFDKNGYRIGFGKGYYDRFLQKYSGIKIGICYNSCIATKLPRGKFDVKADYIITPKYILTTK